MSVLPEVFEIGEKIRLVYAKTAPTKTTCVSLNMLMPVGRYTAEYLVLESYCTHYTEKYPTLNRLNARLEALYGATLSCSAGKVGEAFRLSLQMTCLNDAYALDGEHITGAVLDLLLDMLFAPYLEKGTFEKKRVDTEIRLCLADLESEINDKRAYALHRMIETMCENEAYGIKTADLMADVRAITPQTLMDAWRALLEEATVSICAVGDIKVEKLRKNLEDRFAGVKRHPQKLHTVFVEAAEDVTELEEAMVMNQSKLVLGFRTGMQNKDDGYFARRIMADIFGGGPYSLLFSNVREKLSLCYYCAARLDAYKGLLVVQSGIEADNRARAQAEILKQLEALKAGEFTEETLTASKKALMDIYRGLEDTPESVHAYYARYVDGEILPLDAYLAGIEAVTKDEVIQAAQALSLDTVYFLCGREGE